MKKCKVPTGTATLFFRGPQLAAELQTRLKTKKPLKKPASGARAGAQAAARAGARAHRAQRRPAARARCSRQGRSAVECKAPAPRGAHARIERAHALAHPPPPPSTYLLPPRGGGAGGGGGGAGGGGRGWGWGVGGGGGGGGLRSPFARLGMWRGVARREPLSGTHGTRSLLP